MADTAVKSLTWSRVLGDQLEAHWVGQARPRLDGLTDEEYLWEPVPGCWSVRPRGHGVAQEIGSGKWVIDFSLPEPEPPPLTTIAWRIAHLIVGVLGERNARHFGGPPIAYHDYAYPGTADGALAALDEGYARWLAAVRGLTDDQFAAGCNEPWHEADPMADLVLHINREMIHHLAEVALLRDLYAHRRRDLGPE